MKLSDLRDEIAIEFDAIKQTIAEMSSLCGDIAGREPTTREVAAAGLFLANFYNGIESALKRIWRFHGVTAPMGANWHVELFKAFCDPPQEGLPRLLAPALEERLAPYRRLRHVVHHGYGFRLRWEQMRPGLEGAEEIFGLFRGAVEQHLASLE